MAPRQKRHVYDEGHAFFRLKGYCVWFIDERRASTKKKPPGMRMVSHEFYKARLYCRNAVGHVLAAFQLLYNFRKGINGIMHIL